MPETTEGDEAARRSERLRGSFARGLQAIEEQRRKINGSSDIPPESKEDEDHIPAFLRRGPKGPLPPPLPSD